MCLSHRMLLPVLVSLFLPLLGLGFSSMLVAQTQTTDVLNDPFAVRLAHGTQGQVGAFNSDEIDDVALLTGALSLSIPLGQVYPAGGRLSYQLVAHYSSNDTEARVRTSCTPPPCKVFDADVPYALSQAGRGWLVHLGRLLEPDMQADWVTRSLDDRDHGHNFHEEWIFVEPDGTERHFQSTLHGEPASGAQYTRDGSYYRLKLPSATIASVEMPEGIAYNFTRRTLWPDSAFNRDPWRLTSITDLSGNQIDIEYFSDSWTVQDRYGRVQSVKWEADPWFGGRVDFVTVTTFGGNTATYDFSYVTKEFKRWNAFRTNRDTFTHGQLVKIRRPDTAAYDFTYETGFKVDSGFVINQVALPSGGKLSYTYSGLQLPSALDCDDPNHLKVSQKAVSRRRVLSRSDVTLSDVQYIRKVDDSPAIPPLNAPNPYCLSEGDLAFPGRPKAELVVGVFRPYEPATPTDPGKASLSLNYFSVFPISRLGPNFGSGSTSWKAEEFGQPFTRDEVSEGRFLSTRLRDCAFANWNPQDDLELKADQCVLKRSTFVHMEQDYTECTGVIDPDTSLTSRDATWRCLGTNAQLVERKITYHDDSGHHTIDTFEDNDGFGHYRRQLLAGNISLFGSDETRDIRLDYNPLRRELIRNPDGSIKPSSTWTIMPASQAWYVNGFASRRIGEHRRDGVLVFHQSEAVCFSAQTGLVNAVRVRTDAAGNNDGATDVLYQYFRASQGEPGLVSEIQISGGDRQTISPDGGCNTTSPPEYTYRFEYQRGVLNRAFMVGSTTSLVDHRAFDRTTGGIDRNTGLPRFSWDASGNVFTTYTYDALGRMTSAVRDQGQADDSYVYRLPGVNGWTGAPQITQTTTEGATTLERQISIFDELYREVRRQWLHPQSGDIATVRRYRLDGALEFVSEAQDNIALNSNRGTKYVSDLFGRPVIITSADGTVMTTGYQGIGSRRHTVQVGAVETATGVGLTDAVTTTSFDRFGNEISIQTPNHTTTFNYDSLDRLRWMGRGQQQRALWYDGRGFLTQELLPELGSGAGNDGVVFHQQFDSAGQPKVDARPGSGNRYTYDTLGRLTRVSDALGNPRLTLIYGDSGTGNGRVVTAIRRNVWNTAASGGSFGDGGFGGTAEVLEVTYFNTYEPNGTLQRRTTVITPPFTPSILPTVHFDQDWEHDALGRVRRVGYPLCAFQSHPNLPNLDCTTNNPQQVRNVTLDWGPGDALRSVTNTDTFVGPPDQVFGATLTYHSNGQLASLAHMNGRTDWIGSDPNGMPRLGSLKLAGIAGSSVPVGFLDLGGFQYDGTERITQIGFDRYQYDLNGRLAKAIQSSSGGLTELYTYDQHENFTRKGANFYTHDPLTNRNRATDITYDADGRIVRSGPFKIVYDDLGAQISVINNPNGVFEPCKLNTKLPRPGGCFMNVYGPDGLRVAVMETGGANGLNVGIDWTLRDEAGRVLRTFMHNHRSVVARAKDYIYGGRTLISAFGPVEAPVQDGVRHYHVDHLGSPRVVTASNGAMIGTPRHYAPFGGNANTDTTGERIVDWAGYEEDSNGITHNLHARSYFNGWGRFLSPDPARAGWNLYVYADNNPINMIDPDGLEPCTVEIAQRGPCEVFAEVITVTAPKEVEGPRSIRGRGRPIEEAFDRSWGQVPSRRPPSIRARTSEDVFAELNWCASQRSLGEIPDEFCGEGGMIEEDWLDLIYHSWHVLELGAETFAGRRTNRSSHYGLGPYGGGEYEPRLQELPRLNEPATRQHEYYEQRKRNSEKWDRAQQQARARLQLRLRGRR